MEHPGFADHRRRRRLFGAVMKCADWKRESAQARTRALAAEWLRAAADEVLAGRDGRARALVNRAGAAAGPGCRPGGTMTHRDWWRG